MDSALYILAMAKMCCCFNDVWSGQKFKNKNVFFILKECGKDIGVRSCEYI